jgi:organic radical activating enzyme
MRVTEIFHSIQGEGPAMGRPAIFVRLSGCNLQCEGCDTDHETWRDLSPEAVLAEIQKITSERKIRCDRVIITGGEPTLQGSELFLLIDILYEKGYEVHIETNGTSALEEEYLKKLYCVVVSPKRGSEVDCTRWSAYDNVHFKFVAGPAHWCWTEELLRALLPSIPKRRVWIMPFGSDQELCRAVEAWDIALRLGVNYSDRLHIRLGRR